MSLKKSQEEENAVKTEFRSKLEDGMEGPLLT
jgi:hypothetical protein